MMHTEQSYRAHWAVLTGKAPGEIYVPVALRQTWDCTWCGEPQSAGPVSTCSTRCLEAEIEWADQR